MSRKALELLDSYESDQSWLSSLKNYYGEVCGGIEIAFLRMGRRAGRLWNWYNSTRCTDVREEL